MKLSELIWFIDKKSHLRILETIREMFTETRFMGYVFFVILPMLAALSSHDSWNLKGVLLLFLILNIFVFLCVRSTLDL